MSSSFIDQLPDWLKTYDPLIILGVAALVCLLVIILIIALIKKAVRKPKVPTLVISSFQIAPLGKDAFLKFSNPGEKLTLLSLEILEQNNIKVKNQVAGHVLMTTSSYSILLESANNQRIDANFKIAITFVNEDRKTYRQIFTLDPIESISVRKLRR